MPDVVKVLEGITPEDLDAEIAAYMKEYPIAGYATAVDERWYDDETRRWKARVSRFESCD